MGANFGLEHALWFAPSGVEAVETPSYPASEAFEMCAPSAGRLRAGVGLYETSITASTKSAAVARAPGSIAFSRDGFHAADVSHSPRSSIRPDAWSGTCRSPASPRSAS